MDWLPAERSTLCCTRPPWGARTEVMSRDKVLAICLDLPAAEETYPFGDEVAVIKVGGRMFALVPLFGEPGSGNLKCNPTQALELRAMYPETGPGYHQNRRHWNTVDLDGSAEDDVARGLIATPTTWSSPACRVQSARRSILTSA